MFNDNHFQYGSAYFSDLIGSWYGIVVYDAQHKYDGKIITQKYGQSLVCISGGCLLDSHSSTFPCTVNICVFL
jgi:hypothetical protein